MKTKRNRGKKSFLKCGVPSLLIIGIMALFGGMIAINDPIRFESPGGTNRYARPETNTSYHPDQTRNWGFFFVAISLFFLICAYRMQQDKSR
ncbi:MAG: hypothetical protein RL346_1119 [Verrucomicrobiota bacterium]|jgi:hypothetical protein